MNKTFKVSDGTLFTDGEDYELQSNEANLAHLSDGITLKSLRTLQVNPCGGQITKAAGLRDQCRPLHYL